MTNPLSGVFLHQILSRTALTSLWSLTPGVQVFTCQGVTHIIYKSSFAALHFGPVQLKQVHAVDVSAKFHNRIQPMAPLLSQGLQHFFLHEKFRIRHSLHPCRRSC